MKNSAQRTARMRILSLLLGCILLIGELFSGPQTVYADGTICTGPKVYTYASHALKKDAYSFSIGNGVVTVESVPQKLLSEAKNIHVYISKSGVWENGWKSNQFVWEFEDKVRYETNTVSIPVSLPLPEDDAVYVLGMYITGTDGSLNSYSHHFTVADGDAFFRVSDLYEANEMCKRRCSSPTALYALSRNNYYWNDAKKAKIIKQTAESIVDKNDSDYEKVQKVHDWVANNIWYDFDMAAGRAKGVTDPIEVLNSKRTVCGGYAKLATVLLRALGIPAMYVTGYTRMGQLHAWNEVYVEGQWIYMDTTWDSLNAYRHGVFSEQKPCIQNYFALSLEEFSEGHKVDADENNGLSNGNGVTIMDPVIEGLSVPKKLSAIKKGKTKQISIKATDKNIRLKDLVITYSSSDKKVATVSKTGKVKGKKPGTATIHIEIGLKGLKDGLCIYYDTQVTVKKK